MAQSAINPARGSAPRTATASRSWIRNTIAEAAKTDVQMPWARGRRRAAVIRRRAIPADS